MSFGDHNGKSEKCEIFGKSLTNSKGHDCKLISDWIKEQQQQLLLQQPELEKIQRKFQNASAQTKHSIVILQQVKPLVS
jgi:hypothetical protein